LICEPSEGWLFVCGFATSALRSMTFALARPTFVICSDFGTSISAGSSCSDWPFSRSTSALPFFTVHFSLAV
jgi:hypothetical protein